MIGTSELAGPTARLTLVSGLFDLARRDGTARPGPDEYLRRGRFLLGLDQDLVVFADPELAPEIIERRKARGLLERTVVVPIPFEGLPAASHVERLQVARGRKPVLNANPDKDTARYIALMWSKFELVRRAAALDAFSASHFGWIDFGLAHVARTHRCEEDAVFAQPGGRVRLLMMKSFAADELTDRKSYFSHLRGHIGAGYVTASHATVERLSALFAEDAERALDEGFGPSDEQLLPVLISRAPDLFEFHYGDYPSILENYVRLRASATHLLFVMRNCRELGEFQRGCEIGRRVLDSHREGTFEADPDCLSALLDEYFIAAYHDEYPDQHAARSVALAYADLVQTDAGLREAFLRDEEHIRQNFSFLTNPVPLDVSTSGQQYKHT